MHISKKPLRITGLLFCSLLFVASCTGKSTPTIDPNAIYTQAVLTVSANQTGTAQSAVTEVDLKQMSTQIAETVIADITRNAPAATETIVKIVKPTLTPPDQPGPGQDTAVPGDTAVPTPTRASTKVKVDDLAEFVYQWPTDGHQMNPGQVFDAVWRFRNIGDTVWNDLYTIRWYMESKLGLETLKYTLGVNGNKAIVHRGEVVEITVPGLVAPKTPGHYYSRWRFCNDKVQCFYLVYIEIVVE